MTLALTFLGSIPLGAWLVLILGRHAFWRTGERLGGPPEPQEWPAVAVIVPARDEAVTVARVLESLAAQNYPGSVRIILVDDHSSDETAGIANAAAASAARPVDVLQSPDLPAGWTGKLWALQTGVIHADQTIPEAEFFWFTDADIAHGADVLRRLVGKAVAADRDIVSLMVRLRCAGFWERLLIPAFVFFFQKLYPFPAVNDPAESMAGAAGGCLLVRRRALERAGGLAAIRGALIDDCALAGTIKRSGGRLWLGLGEESRSLRAYPRLADIWDMVARTAFTQLEYSLGRLVLTVVGMGLIYLLPPILVLAAPLHGSALAAILGTLSWGLMALAYAPTLSYYGRPRWAGLALPLAAALYTAMTVSSAFRHWRGQGGRWKTRDYGSSLS